MGKERVAKGTSNFATQLLVAGAWKSGPTCHRGKLARSRVSRRKAAKDAVRNGEGTHGLGCGC